MPSLDNAHALVIGIDSGYPPAIRLPPTADAAEIAGLLANPAEGGYQPGHVRLLTNEQATRETIETELAALAARADADSTVFIYYSGHGGRTYQGTATGHYLLPVDVDIASADAIASSSISGDAFTAALDKLPARKVIVVFDACHAGGVGMLKSADTPAFRPGVDESYYERLASGQGRVIMASSRDEEYSLVFPGDNHGLFTRHFLAGLRGGVAAEDGLVRVFDLFEYLQPRVTAEAATHVPQHPVFKAHLEENLPIALRLGGQPAAIAKDDDGYRYDVYVSYVDQGPDATWVWETLVPRLEDAGLRVAVSGDSADPGVPRLVSQERGIEQARRTIAVLSDTYLTDHGAAFENLVAQTMGVEQGQWRLLPISFGDFDRGRLPTRLGMLTALDLRESPRAERSWTRLTDALSQSAPMAG